jgi:hypothetical protein
MLYSQVFSFLQNFRFFKWCCYRTVQKLILPKSSLMNIPIDVDAKLLIIPEKDVDEYDVMMLAEETCEMVRQLRIEAFT